MIYIKQQQDDSNHFKNHIKLYPIMSMQINQLHLFYWYKNYKVGFNDMGVACNDLQEWTYFILSVV